MAKLSKKDIKEIHRLRSLFPNEIAVRTRRSQDGGFVAQVAAFPGLVTEGETFSELIEMINDAMLTYFEVPRKYVPYISNYIPPLEEVQSFGIFPMIKKENNIKMRLAGSAA